MTPAAPLLRTSSLVLLTLLLVVCTGCAGGIPFLSHQASSSTTPPEVATGAPVTMPARTSAAPPIAANPATLSPMTEPLPRPRQPRPSRFTGPADSSYSTRILTEDATWRGQVLIEGSLTIAPQATLYITPGTTVRFRPTPEGGAGFLLIRGRVQATGTKDAPIIFTTDEINPASGDWQGIMVLDSSKKNLLEWCRVEAAVTGIDAEFSELALRQTTVLRSRTGVAVHSSSVIISGGGASGCVTGFVSRNGDVDLGEVFFSGNHRGIVVNDGSLFLLATEVAGSEGSAVEATRSRLRFEGNSLIRNGSGVTLTGCRGDLIGNRIEENRTIGLELTDSPLRITGNRITGNGAAGVMIRTGGGTLWDNILEGNGGSALVVTGSEDIAAPVNWWGSADPDRIRGRIKEGVGAKVFFVPFLEAPPRLP